MKLFFFFKAVKGWLVRNRIKKIQEKHVEHFFKQLSNTSNDLLLKLKLNNQTYLPEPIYYKIEMNNNLNKTKSQSTNNM